MRQERIHRKRRPRRSGPAAGSPALPRLTGGPDVDDLTEEAGQLLTRIDSLLSGRGDKRA